MLRVASRAPVPSYGIELSWCVLGRPLANVVLVVCSLLAVADTAAVADKPVTAEPAMEPTGPHPRILLDDKLRAAWKLQAKVKDSAVARAIQRCEDTRTSPNDFRNDSYMGFDFSANLNACLIAWVARGSDDDARSAIIYFTALLDDLQAIGDGKGGEGSVRRDTGYAVRSVPPYAALAYDWLHDHPLMTPALREHARERFTQWMSWYKKSGYHNRHGGTNYHAGYALAATFVAVAMGGEGGDFEHELWNHVRDEVWGKDMAKALGPSGILDGGDFKEGWQYAPLSVAEYALSYRVAARHEIVVDGVEAWLQAMYVRTIHARSGARDSIAVGGDYQEAQASAPVSVLTLLAVLIGPAPDAAQRQAAGEIARQRLRAKDLELLYEAVAQANPAQPAITAIDKWPTSYFAPGVATLYARTTWAHDGVWMATSCASTGQDNDHNPPNAGNFVLTRGMDEVLVDPTPYGSLSSLTSNAPTVESRLQLPNYRPSQAPWGETTHFAWAIQTTTGVIASRCDYADQYKFQDRPSDIALAQRDLVVVPWGKQRTDASVIVIDRAETGEADQPMHLRFRSPANLVLEGELARTKLGATSFTIRRLAPAEAIRDNRPETRPEIRPLKNGECWDEKIFTRGGCDASRLPGTEYRVRIPGPKIEAIHVLDASAGSELPVATFAQGVIHLQRGDQDAYVSTKVGMYSTRIPAAGQPAIHVVLIDGAAPAKPTVTKAGAECRVDVASVGPARDPAPFVFTVDDRCGQAEDPRTGPAAPDLAGLAAGKLIPVGGVPSRKSRNGMGCCDAGAGAGSSGVLAILVLGALRRPDPTGARAGGHRRTARR
ncbi:MAG: hypothetical protein H6Q90_583 [Deltaproteobacteria bacterium]|nr:hypothetical protein [Deltaproteobacteria bacterium]